jgi:hypothetical protein
MAKISKIVRSSLARGTLEKSADHPDANLLAAFAENRLYKRERAAVVNHLAQCTDCREYLALASSGAGTESSAVVGSATDRRVRHFSPVWRWASGAAVALCVLAVVWQVRVQLPPAAQSQKSSPVVPAAKSGSPAASAMSKNELETAKDQALSVAKPKPAKPSSKPIRKELRPAEEQAGSQVNLPMAMKSESSRVTPAVPSPDLQSAQAFSAERSRVPMPANQSFRVLRGHLALRSPAEPNALWSINAAPGTASNARGMVQRSTDGGQTWETVHVSDNVDFRTAAADGLDVWAGGTDGALFHSLDGGLHWGQIEVADANTQLRGTIVSIDTRKSPQIAITTNLGETWISMDGGWHWRRE